MPIIGRCEEYVNARRIVRAMHDRRRTVAKTIQQPLAVAPI